MDVKSLDTNMPQNEGIKIIFKAYENFYRQPIPIHYLPEMLRLLILKENFFHFNGEHSATNPWNCNGRKDSSFDSFANIFIAYIETTTLSNSVFKPTVWKCYTDDIFPYGT